MTRTELAVAAVLTAAGIALSALLRPYDSASAVMAMLLTAISAVTATVLFWAGLRAFDVPTDRRTAAAVWAALPWHTLLLSQLAYIGFALVPVEIILSVLILRRRAQLAVLRASLPLAAAVRIATLLVVYAVAAAVRPLLPLN